MKILLNLPLIMLSLMILIYMKIRIIIMLFSKQTRGRPTWSMRATWCPRAPCWWPLTWSQPWCFFGFRYWDDNHSNFLILNPVFQCRGSLKVKLDQKSTISSYIVMLGLFANASCSIACRLTLLTNRTRSTFGSFEKSSLRIISKFFCLKKCFW